MPSAVVKSFAKKSDKSVKQVEKLWDEAQAIVKKQNPKIKKSSKKFYPLVVGILKKMLKLNENAMVFNILVENRINSIKLNGVET